MNTNIIKLYYLPIDQTINKNTFNQLLLFLSKERQERIKCFLCHIDKKLSLYSELLVRIIVCQTLGIKNTSVFFDKNQYGKPYLKGYQCFFFNISHTQNAIVVVISDNTIGVDIERIRKADLKIADRFFTLTEQKYINKTIEKADKRFYEVWTKKEAYMKYVGKGLHMPLNSFDVFDRNISEKLKTFKREDYLITICSDCLDKSFVTIEINEKQAESMALSMLSNNTSIKV